MISKAWRGWVLGAVLGGLLAGACGGDDEPPVAPSGGSSGSAGAGGKTNAGASGKAGRGGTQNGSGGEPEAGAGGEHPPDMGAAGQAANAGETSALGGTVGDSGAGGGGAARGGHGGGGHGGSAGNGGRAGSGGIEGGAAGHAEGGSEMGSPGGDAGQSTGTGGSGATGTGGSGATGGSAGTGPVCTPPDALTSSDPTACIDAADCDRQVGVRGCGIWACNSGSCEASYRCVDDDHDGSGTGPDCACHGVSVDCDDGNGAVGTSTTVSCCNGGTRTCQAGIWGLCTGATGETCDGVDNDCNGTADDLGVVSCGLGACRKTIVACSGGTLGVCIPDAPTTNVDDCNGIDDDCDGAIDEDCTRCFHVAPDGDDTLAQNDLGTTPFASVQAALDFADTHRELANRVCVASGPECGDEATFAGPNGVAITMHEGISLIGRYESTCWTHCDDSITHLSPTTGTGVLFPSSIAVQTTLDGFSVERAFDNASIAAVTVDGARGVALSNLFIKGGARNGNGGVGAGTGDGVLLLHGASASVVKSHVEGGLALTSYALRSIGSELLVEDNCGDNPDASTGRCAASCAGSGPMIQSFGLDSLLNSNGILLDGSPGSRIERSSVCGSPANGYSSGIHVTGESSGVVLRANFIGGQAYGAGVGVLLDECRSAVPWIVNNESIGLIAKQSGGGSGLDLIRAAGDCHPVVENNPSVGTQAGAPAYAATGVHCSAGSVPSRCVLSKNNILGTNEPFGTLYSAGNPIYGTGVSCDGGSCGRIEDNSIVGMTTQIYCQSSACQRQGTGLTMSGGTALVARNTVSGGGASNMQSFAKFTAVGIAASTGGTFVHNGSSDFTGAALDFEWNSMGTVGWNGGGTVSHNCIGTFRERSATADPLVFTSNSVQSYVDENTTTLTTASAINALTDMTSSGNVIAQCTGDEGP